MRSFSPKPQLALMAVTAAGILAMPQTASAQTASKEINIYSAREIKLIQPVLEAFTQDTGIKTNAIFIRDGLEERVKAEGANSPADIILQVDATRVIKAKEMGITQGITSPALSAAVPEAYRDNEGHWFATTLRARVVFASKDRVKETELTYENLADPKWKGKICIRDGQNVYNTSLFSAVISRLGPAKAEEWMKGLKANLAKKPSGGDRDVAKDIASGQCDIGIANTYYYGLMLNNEPERRPWAEAVKVIMPKFEGGGTHVNMSGMAVAKHAPNLANARILADWMLSEKAQSIYARQNFEHPVKTGVALDPTVQAFGPLVADKTPMTEIARNRAKASELVDKTAFNAGPSS
ncbi:MAG: extracellular solute-binding protein [Beijerinckiaceae bacterium]